MSNWIEAEYEESAAAALADEFKLHPGVARVLAARVGADPSDVDAFLKPRLSGMSDPFALPDMEAAVRRVWAGLNGDETIVVFGDYDVDGITSTALTVKVLKALGGKVHFYLPDRIDEGYGLSPEALTSAVKKWSPNLIITVDCGTGSVEAVEMARKDGIDVIVTDHHHVGEEVADAVAVVNPRRIDNPALQILAGVGVAFKLCHAVVKWGREQFPDRDVSLDLRPFLDLVAIGTVADMVPLKGENRVMVRHGLRLLQDTPHLGLESLKTVAGVEGDITTYHVGFLLGPRLNAAGRLGTAEDALELLLTDDDSEAGRLAAQLDAANTERRTIEADTYEQAMAQIEARFGKEIPFSLVVCGKGWHPGVVGIVASRISQFFHRPTIVMGELDDGVVKGSCRSISRLHMVEALDQCSGLLKKYGGHAMAAGVELTGNEVEAFQKQFEKTARSILCEEDLKPTVRLDAWIDLDEADRQLIDALNDLMPFGLGNATPVWGIQEVRLLGAPRILKDKHLKFRVAKGGVERDVIAWNMAHRVLPDGKLDLAVKIGLNEFMGRTTVQLTLVDFKASA